MTKKRYYEGCLSKISTNSMVAVDWLTATTKNDRAGMHWLALYHSFAQASKGEVQKEWKALGYSGFGLPGLSWGYREQQGYLLIARGETAEDIWENIRPAHINVTRLDLQVTVKLSSPDREVVKRGYDAFVSYNAGKQRSVTRIKSHGPRGGETLYVGSRQSSQMGRIYDKGALIGEEKYTLWRYEVELKKPLSLPTFTAIYEALSSDPTGKEPKRQMRGYIWQWFDARGVVPLFAPGDGDVVIETASRVSTAEKKIAWLSTQVKPTVLRLIELGLAREVLTALGINGMGPVVTDRDDVYDDYPLL